MDVWRVIGAVIRRWFVFVPLLGVTFIAAFSVGAWVTPEYTTTAVFGLAPGRDEAPAPDEEPLPENPYSSLTYGASVVAYVLESSETRDQVARTGADGEYEVTVVPRTSFLSLSVTADDPDVAMETGQAVIRQADAILEERQTDAGFAPERFVTVDVLDDADAVTSSVSGQLQALVAVLAAGGLLSFLLAVLVDDLLLVRARRQRGELVATPPTPPAGQAPPAVPPPADLVLQHSANGTGAPKPSPRPRR